MNPRRTIRLLFASAGALALGTTAIVLIAAQRWERETARAVARLDDSSRAQSGRSGETAALQNLPPPVARYLAFALAPGQQPIARARIEHRGEFAQRPGRWAPFSSVQHFSVDPPGFVWNASIRMAPGVRVRVRDSYLEGEGSMLGALGALVPVVEQRGSPGMAAGALARFLAESAWLPTALLPSERLSWAPIDADSARATLRDRDSEVVLDFHFASGGEITRVSGVRYRSVGEAQVLTPFEGRFKHYRRIEGMMVPQEGEVAWLLPEGRYAYWRARIVSAAYERDPAPKLHARVPSGS